MKWIKSIGWEILAAFILHYLFSFSQLNLSTQTLISLLVGAAVMIICVAKYRLLD